MRYPRLVLVDTSVWIHFFKKGDSSEANVLDELLSTGNAAICGPILAEIISGVKTAHQKNHLQDLFAALTDLQAPEDIWKQIGEHRFTLARKGIRASLIDLWIALTAKTNEAAVWTLDQDFRQIAKVIPFALLQIED